MSRFEELYTVREVSKVTGLSRATLLYYERAGVVSPKRDEQSGYRLYDIDDLFRFKTVMMLLRIGYSLKECRDLLVSREVLAEKSLDQYIERLERRSAVHLAEIENIQYFRASTLPEGEVRLVTPPVFYFSADGCENSHREAAGGKVNDALIRLTPLSGFAAIMFNIFDDDMNVIWGRTIRKEHAKLVDIDLTGLPVLGGVPCAACSWSEENLSNTIPDRVIANFRAFMDEHYLVQAGDAFTPYTLTDGTPIMRVNVLLPVKSAES